MQNKCKCGKDIVYAGKKTCNDGCATSKFNSQHCLVVGCFSEVKVFWHCLCNHHASKYTVKFRGDTKKFYEAIVNTKG